MDEPTITIGVMDDSGTTPPPLPFPLLSNPSIWPKPFPVCAEIFAQNRRIIIKNFFIKWRYQQESNPHTIQLRCLKDRLENGDVMVA